MLLHTFNESTGRISEELIYPCHIYRDFYFRVMEGCYMFTGEM